MGVLKSIILPLGLLLFSIIQCDGVEDGCEVKDFFISRDYSSYKIDTVALLPMAYDDTTDLGTFFSTNHFYNRLSEDYKNFHLVDIDKKASSDSIAINNLLISIRDSSKINIDSFYNSDLGKYLKANNCDGIILGNVYNFYRYDNLLMRYGRLYVNKVTHSNFNYLMNSLADGTIIWSANVDGVSKYTYELVNPPNPTPFPPLDVAIANGIDALLIKLKKESVIKK